MKVKLLCSRVGDFGAQEKGAEIDVPDDEGARICAAGQAVEVSPPQKTTRAQTKETAAK